MKTYKKRIKRYVHTYDQAAEAIMKMKGITSPILSEQSHAKLDLWMAGWVVLAIVGNSNSGGGRDVREHSPDLNGLLLMGKEMGTVTTEMLDVLPTDESERQEVLRDLYRRVFDVLTEHEPELHSMAGTIFEIDCHE